MTRVKETIVRHDKGYNCAQSVACTYADLVGLDEATMFKVTEGLGKGMGGTLASERIREYSYWDYPRSGAMKNFGLWPIPQTVIDTNKDVKIEQNEGWN